MQSPVWFRFDFGYGFERQICIGKHLVKYFSENIYQGEMCKSKGGRKLEKGGEEVTVEDQKICFSAFLACPGAAPLQWEGGSAGSSTDLRDLCPAHRQLSMAQF